jgi:hypothetical protein
MNIVDGFSYGILINDSDTVEISNTVFQVSQSGSKALGIQESEHCLIKENIFMDSYYAIGIEINSNNNNLYHNNFCNSYYDHAYDNSENSWDDDYPSGGNYWDDYTGTDVDLDGIGDTPYNIAGGSNQDRYPLMVPYGSSSDPPTVTITSPEQEYLYFNLNDVFVFKLPFIITLILGKLEIEVDAYDDTNDIDHVDFYIDDIWIGNDTTEPYTCMWDEKTQFFQYKIKVIAYDTEGYYNYDEMRVWKFQYYE